MEILEIMQQRHSVRQYTDRAIEPEKRAVLDALTQEINRKAGLSVQIIYDDPQVL